MQLKEHAYKILVISSNDRMAAALAKIIVSTNLSNPVVASSIPQAKRLVVERTFDFMIISSPVGHDNPIEFAIDTHEECGTGIIILTRDSEYEETYDKTHEYGILTLSKPTPTELFIQALRMLTSSKNKLELSKLKSPSNMTLKDKMEEIRITNEAKLLLMKYEKLSEGDAHKQILKTAMDYRLSKSEVAHQIIEKYSTRRGGNANE